MMKINENLIHIFNNFDVYKKNNKDFTIFKKKINKIDTNIETIDYFYFPLEFKNKTEYKEIRGITYNKKLNKLFPSISKFFVYPYQYTDKEIESMEKDVRIFTSLEKQDGSLIIPYLDSSNEIKFKTKFSFDNSIIDEVNLLIKKQKQTYKLFINELYKLNYQPLFEYISPTNKIVVDYNKSDLVLIAIRDMNDFSYIEFYKYNKIMDLINKYNISTTKINKMKNITLKEYYNQIKDLSGIEGFVVYTNKGLFKLKTEWYMEKHRVANISLNDKKIRELIVNNKIDEIDFNNDDLLRERIKNLEIEYINLYNDFEEVLNKYKNINRIDKEIAIKISNEKLSGYIFQMIRNKYEVKNLFNNYYCKMFKIKRR